VPEPHHHHVLKRGLPDDAIILTIYSVFNTILECYRKTKLQYQYRVLCGLLALYADVQNRTVIKIHHH